MRILVVRLFDGFQMLKLGHVLKYSVMLTKIRENLGLIFKIKVITKGFNKIRQQN